MSEGPLPRFTIEELLREAVEAVPTDERCVFTTKELAELWGYESQKGTRGQMDKLQEIGWQFLATRKSFVNRAGILTTTFAYIVIPPSTGSIDGEEPQ